MSKEKLFDFRTVEGQVNCGAISDIREIERKLGCFPPFVGLAVRGSTTRGYSTEFSDLDLVLLYDSSISSHTVDNESHPFSFMLMVAEYGFSSNSRSVEMKKKDINPERLSTEVPIIPADIFRIVTGTKIAKYRKLYSEYISQQPKDQRNMIVEGLALELMVDDSLGWQKMTGRVSGVPISDYVGEVNLYNEVLKANGISAPREIYEKEKLRLWQTRIKRLLQI